VLVVLTSVIVLAVVAVLVVLTSVVVLAVVAVLVALVVVLAEVNLKYRKY
jgi:hypothetical protein